MIDLERRIEVLEAEVHHLKLRIKEIQYIAKEIAESPQATPSIKYAAMYIVNKKVD